MDASYQNAMNNILIKTVHCSAALYILDIFLKRNADYKHDYINGLYSINGTKEGSCQGLAFKNIFITLSSLLTLVYSIYSVKSRYRCRKGLNYFYTLLDFLSTGYNLFYYINGTKLLSVAVQQT